MLFIYSILYILSCMYLFFINLLISFNPSIFILKFVTSIPQNVLDYQINRIESYHYNKSFNNPSNMFTFWLCIKFFLKLQKIFLILSYCWTYLVMINQIKSPKLKHSLIFFYKKNMLISYHIQWCLSKDFLMKCIFLYSFSLNC